MPHARPVTIFVWMVTVLLAFSASAVAQPLATKSIAAPASDILSGVVRRPDASRTGVSSSAASHPIRLERGADGVWRASVEFYVGDPATARLMIVSPDAGAWDARVRFADGQVIELNDAGETDARVKRHFGSYGIEGVLDPATMFEVAGTSRDKWTLEITAPPVHQANGREKYASKSTHGYLLVTSDDPIAMYAWAAGGVVGEPIEFYASLYDTSVDGRHRVGEAMPTPVDGEMRSRNIRSSDGGGGKTSIDMARAGKSEVVGTETFDNPGLHRVEISFDEMLASGRRVQRSATVLIPVVDAHAAIESVATTIEGDVVEFEMLLTDARLPDHFFAAAEVWGTTAQGAAPIAWIGGMMTPEFDEDEPGRATFSLEMHADWVALGSDAGAHAPYTLRNIRLEDSDFHVRFAGRDAMSVDLPASLTERTAAGITTAMLTGRLNPHRAVAMQGDGSAAAANGIETDFAAHNLMLVHGYCAGGNPWPTGQFASPIDIFGDPNQSRSNDAFAQLIGAQSQDSKSFGVIAHSQGGLAALHLYTFYWSGLDWARGARLIQSVGSPYQGTALAGELAALGDIFGSGCGENFDMTYAGAAAWLATIPTWARQGVYYHTTSFDDPPGGFDYCNFISNFFLDNPEDGVVEQMYAQLPGANNMGHKEGWCHTTGMQDPAQYLDTARNADMNANAAR